MEIVALGLNSSNNYCNCIYSNASFEELCRDFNKCKKKFEATNWSGSDDLKRTLRHENLKISEDAEYFHLPKSYNVVGEDYDHGVAFKWSFSFDTLVKVESLHEKLNSTNWEFYKDQLLVEGNEYNANNPIELFCKINKLKDEIDRCAPSCYGECKECIVSSLDWLSEKATVLKKDRENKEVSNFERYGNCDKCPVDNTDPFQLPGACHRCLDIRGL